MRSGANFFRRNVYDKAMAMLRKFFEVNFFFSNVLIPLLALALYCGSFAYFSSRLLLDGVNYVFVSKFGKYLLFVLAGAVLTFLLILKVKGSGGLTFKNPGEKIYSGDLLLLLLPLTPVLQYILSNQEMLSPAESLYALALFAVFSAVYIFALPALLVNLMPVRTLMVMGLAFVFTIASMASISDYFSWFEEGTLRKQLMFFGAAFLVVWLLYNLNKRKILYLFLALNFAVSIPAQLLSAEEGAKAPVVASDVSVEENKLLSLVGERTPAIKPNIYLLVYDAYVSSETLLAYGIDNSAQEVYLSEQGFKLYPHTYSIGSATVETMSKVLNASSEYYGESRRGVSGDGITQRILKNIGYKTYGLFPTDYMFRGVGSRYDFSFPESVTPAYVHLLKGVFIYTHSNLPAHSQNSGACLPNETELFEERLMQANIEMRQDLDLILGNDPGAIVIIAGDHGPYLTKNCYATTGVYDISEISRLDIQDRYGTFLAIRWPTGDFVKYDDITILQDVFPAIFAYLYEDTKILEAKIEPVIPVPNSISGVSVKNGIIYGGIDDGEPLFLSGK